MKNKFKVGDRIWYLSFGKKQKATIKKINLDDQKQLKVLPDGRFTKWLAAVKAENATLIINNKNKSK